MKRLALPLLLLTSSTAQALDAACEMFIAAAEKTAQQPARHTLTESTDLRLEAITVGGASWTRMDGGAWRTMKTDLLAAEKDINAQVRSGAIPLSDCKDLGSESLEGLPTRVIAYSLSMFGMPPAASKAYIGKDGLIHALRADDTRVRYRYTGVAAPK